MAQTPWGRSDSQTTWAPGIIDYGTASHGGIYLNKERQAELPEWARVTNFLRTLQWWEDDADWCVPFLVFLPEIQTYAAENPNSYLASNFSDIVNRALNTARTHYPTVYAGYMASQTIKPQ